MPRYNGSRHVGKIRIPREEGEIRLATRLCSPRLAFPALPVVYKSIRLRSRSSRPGAQKYVLSVLFCRFSNYLLLFFNIILFRSITSQIHCIWIPMMLRLPSLKIQSDGQLIFFFFLFQKHHPPPEYAPKSSIPLLSTLNAKLRRGRTLIHLTEDGVNPTWTN